MPRATGKAAKASNATPVAKPDAMDLLFRREANLFLASPPGVDGPVKVLAQVERLIGDGGQESLQLCTSGDTKWVTRTQGERSYFPMIGRVGKAQKRVRDEDEEPVPIDEEEVPAAKPAKKRKGKGRAVPQEDTPVAPRMTRDVPGAPGRRHRRDGRAGSEDTVLATKARRTQEFAAKSHRYSTRGSEENSVVVKAEEADDLLSLCGGVGNLDFKSVADAASEAGRQTPVASTSNLNLKKE